MTDILRPFRRNEQGRKRKTKTYDSEAALRLGVNRASQPQRDYSHTGRASRSGHQAGASLPDYRRKKTRAREMRIQREAPVVMVRALPNALPHQPVRQGRKSRRRFDVALGLPGAEVRLPGLPQVAVGWRVVSFLLVAVLAFLLYQLWNASAFQVEAVRLSGLKRLTSSEVNAALGMAGERIFFLSPEKISEELLQIFPEFSEASVQVSLPNNVTVQVVERLPVITWVHNGQVMLVDEQGYGFSPRAASSVILGPSVEAASSPPALPQPITSEPSGEEEQVAASSLGAPQATPTITTGALPFLSPEMVSAIRTIASQAPAGAPLIYTLENGLGWRDPGGWDVFFGDAQDMPMKLIVYQSIIARLDDKEETLPSMVSVEHVHAPFYRPR